MDPHPLTAATITLDVLAASHDSAAALARRQARRLQALIEVAQANSPLWRRRLADLDPAHAQLADLPVTRKPELMADFEGSLTHPQLRLRDLRRFLDDPAHIGQAWLGHHVAWESSGSQGEPGVFIQDATAMAVYDALEAARRPLLQPLRRLFDPWLLGERIAFVGATGGHFASTVSVERVRRLNPAMASRLRGFSFLQPLAQLVAQLQQMSPSIVATYPSVALVLADEQQAGRLSLRLCELWTGGESLSPPARHRIEQVFGCPVANAYGASEFLPIASPCRLGRLHVNSDWVLLEPVDAQGHPVPPGETGATTLLTNLANHLQPLIRLDIGDRTRFARSPCACGSALPVIEVDGRCDDSLQLAGLSGRPVTLTPLALCTVLEDEAGLFDFQLVQQGPAELVLHAADTPARRQARTALARFLDTQGTRGVQLRVAAPRADACLRSGKRKRVLGYAGDA